jgi:hypothetical protein
MSVTMNERTKGIGWRLLWAALVVGAVARPAGAAPPDTTEDTLRAVERFLAEENWPAALSQVEGAVAAHPEDCTLRAWLAWIEIESGRGDPAESRLASPGCPVGPEDRGRWALLRALGAERRADADAVRSALREVGERQPLWPEDRTLVRTLSVRHLEGHTLPLEARAEIALGATSNAFAMSPTDAARREAPGSGVARPDLRLDLRAPEGAVTPSLELGARGYGLSNAEAREVSHANLTVAAALRLGRGGWLPTVRYRHDELLLDAAGGRYSAANEAEVELSPSRAVTLYGGAGHRVFFTDDWRTRDEWNLAGLVGTSVLTRPVVLGGAFRYYRAHRDVHDQVGGTLTAAGELPLGASLRARLSVSGAYDDFPRSGGPDGLVAFGSTEKRRDVTLRVSAGIWRSLGSRAALGLTYELGRRWSTADSGLLRYYPYVDHRVLVSLRVGDGGNPWRRRGPEVPGRVALPWRDVGPQSVLWDDQMRRLLRQEEDLAADCGCLVP